MRDEPRTNKRLMEMVEISYDTSLFVGDEGRWTVFEIVKRPIAQTASKEDANRLIERLKKTAHVAK